jgi:glycogen(starch) synthase
MRVWLAPSAFFPHRGGVEELTLKMALELTRRDVEVTVVTHQWPRDLPATDRVEGIAVRRMSYTTPARRPASLAEHVRRRGAVGQQLEQLGAPDVIHVICAANQTAPLAAHAKRHGVPLVLTTQGETVMDADQVYAHNPWLRRSLRRASTQASALTACSQWTRVQTARIAPAFATAAVVLNGVDTADWPVAPRVDEPVIAAWGRHVEQKGFDLLLTAFGVLRRQRPDARLLLGGDGPAAAALRAAAPPGVEFRGGLDRAGVRGLLAEARVAAVPSRIEPFGIVALEALASGRGLVYSVHGGLREAAGGCGRGADPFDAPAFAAALAAELEHPTAPEVGRARADQLSWSTVVSEYVGLYRAALS